MKKPKPNKQTSSPNPNQQRRNEDECKVRGEIHVRGEIETNLPPGLMQEHKTEREEDKTNYRKNYVVSVITLAAVILYALLTFWQGCMTREIITNTRKSERPYIWTTKDGVGSPEFVPNKFNPSTGQIAWTFHYTAYGRSPAYVVTAYESMRVGADKPFRESYGFSKAKQGSSTPVPIGADYFKTVVSDPGITPGEYADLIKSDDTISIKVRFAYKDGYGERYETGICLNRLATGAIEFCAEDNYIK